MKGQVAVAWDAGIIPRLYRLHPLRAGRCRKFGGGTWIKISRVHEDGRSKTASLLARAVRERRRDHWWFIGVHDRGVVAAPGLFSFAGHSEVPFFSLLGLHWTYLLALVSVGFCAAALVPNALGSFIIRVDQPGGGRRLLLRGRVAGKVQRRHGLHLSLEQVRDHPAVVLAVPPVRLHVTGGRLPVSSKKRCRVWGAYKGEAYISSDYGCSAPDGKSLDEAKDSALAGLGVFLGEHRCPAFDEALQYAVLVRL